MHIPFRRRALINAFGNMQAATKQFMMESQGSQDALIGGGYGSRVCGVRSNAQDAQTPDGPMGSLDVGLKQIAARPASIDPQGRPGGWTNEQTRFPPTAADHTFP